MLRPQCLSCLRIFSGHILIYDLDQEVFEDTLKGFIEVTCPRYLPDVRHQDGVHDLGDGGPPLPLPEGWLGVRGQAGVYDVGQGGGEFHHDQIPELVGQVHREGAFGVIEPLKLLKYLMVLHLKGKERGEEGGQLLKVDKADRDWRQMQNIVSQCLHIRDHFDLPGS